MIACRYRELLNDLGIEGSRPQWLPQARFAEGGEGILYRKPLKGAFHLIQMSYPATRLWMNPCSKKEDIYLYT